MNFSFFFKDGGSGEIRGKQMGEFLGAKLNPKSEYENDVCIYVKHYPHNIVSKNTYVDIVDGVSLVSWLKENEKVKVITTSLTGKEYLEGELKRDVIWIPEHHCNYENFLRKRNGVQTVGVIGNLKGFGLSISEMYLLFQEIGIDFVFNDSYTSRYDVSYFYMNIDVQICWRPHVNGAHAKLHNPLKLANACSFGVPTVAFPEDNFLKEFAGCFLPAESKEEIINIVKELKEYGDLYDEMSLIGIERARNYHIENVAKMYEGLKNDSSI